MTKKKFKLDTRVSWIERKRSFFGGEVANEERKYGYISSDSVMDNRLGISIVITKEDDPKGLKYSFLETEIRYAKPLSIEQMLTCLNPLVRELGLGLKRQKCSK